MTNRYCKLLLFLSFTLTSLSGAAIAEAREQGTGNSHQSPVTREQGVMPSLVAPISDPLIPEPPVARPLSPLEQGQIGREAERLYLSGFVHWQGQAEALAYRDWFRHLRLLQVLPDRQLEIERLGEIGAIAWENNNVEESRAISARLDIIRATDFPEDETLLLPLATAYQQLREAGSAIALYQTHLETLEDPYKADILRLIAELAISWFDHEEALAAYKQIEALNALTITDREHFAKLYDTLNDPANALRIREQLPPLYLQEELALEIIRIDLAIANNHRQLNNDAEAIRYTEHAFRLAWEFKYFELAATALDNLATIYKDQGKSTFAAQVYEQLLIVQNFSYNRFGMMETYGKLGNLYQQTEQYPDALVAFQNALAIAKELNHNINFYTQAIETLPSQQFDSQ